jgi:hypothetical protein
MTDTDITTETETATTTWTYEGYWATIGACQTTETAADSYLASGERSVAAWLSACEAEAWDAAQPAGDMPAEWADYHGRAVSAIEAAMISRPRVWTILQDSQPVGEVTAASPEEAEELAAETVDTSVYYHLPEEVELGLRCYATGESGVVTVECDADAASFELDSDGAYVTMDARTQSAASALCARLRAAGYDPSDSSDDDGGHWVWLSAEEAEKAEADGLIVIC